MPRFVSVGECFVELFGDSETGYQLAHAGFAGEMAQLMRKRLGADWTVDLFTALGDDVHSQRMVEDFAASGVGIGHILKIPGRTVGLSLVDQGVQDGPMETDWRSQAAARSMADDPEVLAAAFNGADIIYVTGSAFAILLPRARGRLLKALYDAREAGSRIVAAPIEWPGLWTSRRVMGSTINAAATIADAVITNVPGERASYGDGTAEMIAARYHEAGVGEVLVSNVVPPRLYLSTSVGARWHELDNGARAEGCGAAYLAARAEGGSPEDAIVSAVREKGMD